MKNYRRRGFTLIEILVAISIISILSIGASQVNWSRISEAQKIDSYRGDIKTAIEEVRNNALIGKWIGNTLEVPVNWQIDMTTGQAGWLRTKYLLEWAGSYSNFDTINIPSDEFYSISEIRCLQIDRSVNETISGTVTLSFTWGTMGIIGCSDSNSKILEFDLSYKQFQKSISFHGITGTIENK